LAASAALAAVTWLWLRPARPSASRIQAAISDRRFEEASKELDQWMKRDSKDALALAMRGRLLLAQEKPQEALAAFNQAQSLGHPEADLEGPVGVILARAGRHKEAEPLLLRARERAPAPDADLEEALARVFIDSFRFGPALDAIDRWIKADPKSPTAWLWRAQVNDRTGAPLDQIAEDFQRVLERDPASDTARLGIADALRGLGRHEDALREYRLYLEQHPGESAALACAGLSALEAGNEDQACEFLEHAIQSEPANAIALDGLAAIALRRRQSEKALSLIDTALEIDKFNPDFHYRRALALDGLGRRSEASTERQARNRLRTELSELGSIRTKLLRTPTDRELQARLALWLLDHGRDDEGVIWARRVLDSPDPHPEVAAALVRYYEHRGDTGLANFFRVKARETAASAAFD
jgi:tetratricopeptide (TPR) repeat protein